MANERTWEIEDCYGSRHVTLAEFRADLEARAVMARKVADAVRRGDHDGCAKAQADMRAKFRS